MMPLPQRGGSCFDLVADVSTRLMDSDSCTRLDTTDYLAGVSLLHVHARYSDTDRLKLLWYDNTDSVQTTTA